MQSKTIIKNKNSYKSMFKEIAKIALPISLQALLSTMVQLIDSLFIGHLESATSLAAGINAINNMTYIIFSIVAGIVAGIGVYFAQASGKGDKSYQKQLFVSKVFWMTIWGALGITIMLAFLTPISKLWIANDAGAAAAVQSAKDYGYIIFPSMGFQFILLVFSSSFQEMKLTKVAMWVAVSGIITNASLNYPFMYTFGWGVSGSAYATLIARCVELSIWFAYIFKAKPNFLPGFKDFKSISFKKLLSVLPKSLLWMINSLAISMAFTMQIMFMSKTSTDAGAAMIAAGVVSQLVASFSNGYITAMSILVMHKLANKSISLKELAHKYAVLSLITGIVMGLVLMGVAWSIFGIYPTYNSNTKWQAVWMLYGIASTMWVGLMTSVYISIFKSSGLTKSLLIMDGVYSWVIQFTTTICLVYLVPGIEIGFIYWIVMITVVFKPLFMRLYFNKKRNSFKVLIDDKKEIAKRA